MPEPENSVDTLAPEEERAKSPLRGALIALLKFGVAAGILYILMRRGELHWDQLRAALSRWDISLSVVALTIASYYGQAVRWRWLLRSRDIPIHSWTAFRYLMIGKFFNLVVPGYFSEDFVRGLYVIRQGEFSRTRVIVSLLVDRVAGVVSMLIFGAAGLLLRPAVLGDPRLRALLALSLGGLAGVGAVWLFIRLIPEAPAFLLRLARLLHVHMAVDRVYSEASHYAHHVGLLFGVVALTLFNQGLMLMCFWLFGQTLQMDVVPLDYAVYVPAGMLATMLPVAPVGLGVGQVAFLALFRLAGSDQGANLFSVYTAVVIFLNLAGGLLYLAHRDRPKA